MTTPRIGQVIPLDFGGTAPSARSGNDREATLMQRKRNADRVHDFRVIFTPFQMGQLEWLRVRMHARDYDDVFEMAIDLGHWVDSEFSAGRPIMWSSEEPINEVFLDIGSYQQLSDPVCDSLPVEFSANETTLGKLRTLIAHTPSELFDEAFFFCFDLLFAGVVKEIEGAIFVSADDRGEYYTPPRSLIRASEHRCGEWSVDGRRHRPSGTG